MIAARRSPIDGRGARGRAAAGLPRPRATRLVGAIARVGLGALFARFAFVATVGLSGLSSARADTLDDRAAAARKAYLTRLEDLATWCDQQRVFATRDGVFRRILLLAPDHARARAALKYKREGKAAPWVQAADYKEPIDWNKGVIGEAKKRVAASNAEYRQDVMASLEAAGDVKPARRDEAIERLVDLMPDDADLRRARGDVESGGRWVLSETVESRGRRKEIDAAARRARDAGAGAFERDEAVAGAGWKFAWKVEGRVVAGTGTAAEGTWCAQTVAAVGVFCRDLLSLEARPQGPKSIFVFADRAAGESFVRKHAAGDADTLAGLDRVASLWLKDGDLVVLHEKLEMRRESMARQMIDAYLRLRQVGESTGWVTEGVGQRLMWHLLGTHGSSFVSYEGTDRPSDERDDAPLPPKGESWMRAAYEAVDRSGPVGFQTLFTRKINAFRSVDVLIAYGLAAYVMEARPDQFVAFLQAAGTLEGADAVCQNVLSVDADVLYWRVRRWLSEASDDRAR